MIPGEGNFGFLDSCSTDHGKLLNFLDFFKSSILQKKINKKKNKLPDFTMCPSPVVCNDGKGRSRVNRYKDVNISFYNQRYKEKKY